MDFASFGSPTGKPIALDLACIRQARCILIRKVFENGAQAIAQAHHPAVFNPSASVNPLTFNIGIGYLAVFVVFGVAFPTVTIKNLLGSMRSL